MSKLIMSPGPTEINRSVLEAMATKGTNPDLDPTFFEDYKRIENKYNRLVVTKSGQSLFMAGEALLGLEAACATLIEPGDEVLCIANGYFGAGFKGFIELYGGMPIMLETDWQSGVPVETVEEILAKHPNIKLATMVHCETPTGISNHIEAICQLLSNRQIISIVDSVSGIAGEYIDFDNFKIDVLLGGTQKCLSAPAGLTLITLSERAVQKMRMRKTSVASHYLSIINWLDWYQNKEFPYTQAVQNIYGLEVAIDDAISSNFVQKHSDYAKLIRKVIVSAGFKLYANDHLSNTVTAIWVPAGIDYNQLYSKLNDEHNIIIGGCLGDLYGKVFRIGHMGANNKPENFDRLFKALDQVLTELGHPTSLCKLYNEYK